MMEYLVSGHSSRSGVTRDGGGLPSGWRGTGARKERLGDWSSLIGCWAALGGCGARHREIERIRGGGLEIVARTGARGGALLGNDLHWRGRSSWRRVSWISWSWTGSRGKSAARSRGKSAARGGALLGAGQCAARSWAVRCSELGSPATERERRGIVAALLVFECRGSERDRPERDRRNGGIWGEIWGSFSGLEDLSLGEEEELGI
ncbi:uncharacterized protein A4U43_C03F13390 [Asparagus officinalis]|uniref:Uncharacterized protein n=1 Tax=Asparagus officinalis TaxID=4686 RepID=A0A5P1FCK3_ASPOF|nr:uncharacterized protein A4U43_C03F13390 [Asparagus officinalis]